MVLLPSLRAPLGTLFLGGGCPNLFISFFSTLPFLRKSLSNNKLPCPLPTGILLCSTPVYRFFYDFIKILEGHQLLCNQDIALVYTLVSILIMQCSRISIQEWSSFTCPFDAVKRRGRNLCSVPPRPTLANFFLPWLFYIFFFFQCLTHFITLIFPLTLGLPGA